jgi:hypothetical protein
MSDQNNPENNPDEPASWSTHYMDPSGFECELTLRAANGADLLKKAGAALLNLVNAGCQPVQRVANIGGGSKPIEAPKMPDGSPDPTWCTIHGLAMSRHEKNGQIWFSHKVGDDYCKGGKK